MRQIIMAYFIIYTTTASGQPSNINDATNANAPQPLISANQLIATLETDRQTAYVNEQILLTLRVSAPSIAFNITGDKPALPGVELLPVNRQESTFEFNGTSHQSITTVFALFVTESGTLQIPTLSFKAVLPVSAGLQGSTRGNPTLTATTDALQLTIETNPTSNATWLPAQNVQVASSWSIDTATANAVRAGEPVTRHIAVTIQGQRPGAIPQLDVATPDGVRSYPDQPQLETDVSVTGINGNYTQAYAIVASREGKVTLPAINIEWWDINDHEWRTTTLPGEQLQIAAAEVADAPPQFLQQRHYPYALAGLSAAVIMLTGCCFALWRHNRKLTGAGMPTEHQSPLTERAAWSQLQGDIRRSNVAAIRHSLVQWGKALWPDRQIHRLEQMTLLSSSLQSVMGILNEHLYSQQSTSTPDLDSLNQALRTIRKAERKKRKAKKNVTELYPGS